MGRAEQKAKDQARAGYMKQHGIERTTGICPVCYKPVSIDNAVKKTRFSHNPGFCGIGKKWS